ncbi:hypothetical protein K0M31_009547 [Melipona bicolor]|uniref:Peptidase M13 C-terminal domain-containing protein n=1 Tax=Melipona bicolor TaxID=60889 RepID=A0AA40FNY2_9HYME|nr:hypothetical protein K0M31_009547 [Melipona bicolor]
MTEQYYKSVQCFIDQYDNYTLNRTPSGPKVEENMPDTMGMKTAFKAYKRREIINGVPELKLPSLEMFDNDQLFFLSFANLCETRDSKAIEEELPMHSIGPLRSIGAFSNNQDFAETFSCPLGSPMNPKKKCNIWKI